MSIRLVNEQLHVAFTQISASAVSIKKERKRILRPHSFHDFVDDHDVIEKLIETARGTIGFATESLFAMHKSRHPQQRQHDNNIPATINVYPRYRSSERLHTVLAIASRGDETGQTRTDKLLRFHWWTAALGVVAACILAC